MLVAKISGRNKVFLTIAVLSLFLGLLNYILFEPSVAVGEIFHLRFNEIVIHQTLLRSFLTGHISDMAWATSLYLCVVVLSEEIRLQFIDRIALLLLPFLTETLQGFHLIYGTFDWYDMISYIVVLSIFLSFFPQLIFKKNEKV